MGESCQQVAKEIDRVPYKVVCGANDTPRVDIDGREYTPQEISAMILQKMKKNGRGLPRPGGERGCYHRACIFQ